MKRVIKSKPTLAMIAAAFLFSGIGYAQTVRPMGNPRRLPPPAAPTVTSNAPVSAATQAPAPGTRSSPPSVAHHKTAAAPNTDANIIQYTRSKPLHKLPPQPASPPPPPDL